MYVCFWVIKNSSYTFFNVQRHKVAFPLLHFFASLVLLKQTTIKELNTVKMSYDLPHQRCGLYQIHLFQNPANTILLMSFNIWP